MDIDNTISGSDDDNDDNERDILIFLQLLHSEILEVTWVENLACRELRNLACELKKSEIVDVDKGPFSTIRERECDNCDMLQMYLTFSDS
jgi:hypothetical protein